MIAFPHQRYIDTNSHCNLSMLTYRSLPNLLAVEIQGVLAYHVYNMQLYMPHARIHSLTHSLTHSPTLAPGVAMLWGVPVLSEMAADAIALGLSTNPD